MNLQYFTSAPRGLKTISLKYHRSFFFLNIWNENAKKGICCLYNRLETRSSQRSQEKTPSYICISLSIFCFFLFIITVIKKVFSWINITEQRIQCDWLCYTTKFFSSNLAVIVPRLYSNRNCHLLPLYKIPLCLPKPF